MKKSAIVASILVVLIIGLCFLIGDYRDISEHKEMVSEYVLSGMEQIEKCISDGNYDNLPQGIEISRIENLSKDEALFFACGAVGIGPDGLYFGFYYSPKSVPVNTTASFGYGLKKDGNGYGWKQKDGNMRYYTEQIAPKFFWYEYAT